MKTILITGGARGIGASCARLLLQKGYNVVINYNNSKKEAQYICESFEPCALAIKADVSVRKEVSKMFYIARKKFKRIDVLINNAGISQQKLFTEISEYEWDRMFNVNVKGMFNCCQEAIPEMIRNHQGNIINVSSIWGEIGASCEVHYSASKGAVISLTKALAKELGPSNIRVNCVSPGVINTDMNENLCKDTIEEIKSSTPLGIIGDPLDIANIILFMISNKSKFITGQVISVNGGFVL